MTPTDPTPDIATLLARAKALQGRCHRCAFLRQEHQPDMGHRIEDRMTASPGDIIAILDRLARAEAAVPDDPWLYDDGRGYGLTCYSCVQWKDLGHRENCKWLAARPAR
jgi:hypothetical protein